MRVLVVGGGGREHAIAWKLAHSPRVTDILVAPGNAGTAFSSPMPSRNVPIPVEDIPALVECALEQHVDFTVIGPDNPLAEGIVDAFTAKGLRVFGPTQAAARLEWSKAFAKTLMREIGVPTADFRVFEALEPALGFVRSRPFSSSGFVIKADGLALGKGVIVCDDLPEAEQALERMFEGEFGVAGARVLVEERLNGPEVSALCFTDGQTVRLMVPARDHKRALDGDQGPNTGGMGAFAPAPDVMPAMLEEIQQRILEPVVHAMRERGTPYQGVLYAGLMLTPNGIQVIEFNARFGDPETQVLLPMLETDLLDVLEACVNGTLGSLELRWRAGACATVAIASPGYPGVYRKGLPITGLEAVPDGVTVFHAGTKRDGDAVLTNGGRVLNVTAMGSSLEQALGLAYQGVASIHFDGMHYRRDIGRAVSALPSSGPGVQ